MCVSSCCLRCDDCLKVRGHHEHACRRMPATGGCHASAPANPGEFYKYTYFIQNTPQSIHTCHRMLSILVYTSRSRRKGRERGRICKDRSTVLCAAQENENSNNIKNLLYLVPFPPPVPRSRQAASEATPTVVQAPHAGLQPPPRPLSCCYINQ